MDKSVVYYHNDTKSIVAAYIIKQYIIKTYNITPTIFMMEKGEILRLELLSDTTVNWLIDILPTPEEMRLLTHLGERTTMFSSETIVEEYNIEVYDNIKNLIEFITTLYDIETNEFIDDINKNEGFYHLIITKIEDVEKIYNKSIEQFKKTKKEHLKYKKLLIDNFLINAYTKVYDGYTYYVVPSSFLDSDIKSELESRDPNFVLVLYKHIYINKLHINMVSNVNLDNIILQYDGVGSEHNITFIVNNFDIIFLQIPNYI